jgi:hypothetical protein
VIFQIKNLHVPTIWVPSVFPGTDSENIRFLGAVLHALKFDVEAWAAALELYKFAKLRKSDLELSSIDRDLARKWQWIAIHECVMQMYYLRERMRIVRGEKLKACPSMAQHVDNETSRTAIKLLDAHFPDIDKLRDAIAHSSGRDSRPHLHAPDGELAPTRISTDDKLEVPYKGRVIYLDIGEKTLQELVLVVKMFLSAFEPAEKALERVTVNLPETTNEG